MSHSVGRSRSLHKVGGASSSVCPDYIIIANYLFCIHASSVGLGMIIIIRTVDLTHPLVFIALHTKAC